MALTFSNYVITPFFPDCPVPDDAVRLLAAAAICMFLYIFYRLEINQHSFYEYLQKNRCE